MASSTKGIEDRGAIAHACALCFADRLDTRPKSEVIENLELNASRAFSGIDFAGHARMPSLLIVSEVRLFRDGLAELLARRDSLRVLSTAKARCSPLHLRPAGIWSVGVPLSRRAGVDLIVVGAAAAGCRVRLFVIQFSARTSS